MVDAQHASPITIVTGASRGIGRAIAEALAGAGHRLVLVARSEDALRRLADDLRSRGADTHTVTADLRDEDAPATIVRATEQRFGAPTNVVSNAGTAPADKVENTTPAILRETFDLHVAAPLGFARACAPAMKKAGAGCLLHLASTAGLRGYPFTSAYTAAKHGMVGLSRALHAELGPAGIRVYAVCPGFVDSDITRAAAAAVAAKGKTTADQAFARMASQNRIGRMHLPHEVAATVAMLLRERPTGCVYELDRADPAFLD
ncbi:MAG: SDR family oxidoreductase [Planctomycetes bacterium]|nr:SDR family oxidoreductase [Planctomycetota bacterium]